MKLFIMFFFPFAVLSMGFICLYRCRKWTVAHKFLSWTGYLLFSAVAYTGTMGVMFMEKYDMNTTIKLYLLMFAVAFVILLPCFLVQSLFSKTLKQRFAENSKLYPTSLFITALLPGFILIYFLMMIASYGPKSLI